MIRVTMEIVPRGDEKKAFVAGVLTIENDLSGSQKIGNYDLRLTGPVDDGGSSIPNEYWSRGRLEGHQRAKGWWTCVKEALCAMKTDYDIPMI